jgi:CRP/FNR family transcriptional regulator
MRARSLRLSFPFFEQLTAQSRALIDDLPVQAAPAQQQLLQRGDPAGGVYLVLGGSLRVYYVAASGRESTLYRVQPGGTCLLALSASYEDGPYPAWASAGSQGARFVCLARPLFLRLLDDEASFRAFAFAALSGRIHELMISLEEEGSVRVEQRVARYLLRSAGRDGVLSVSQQALASELGTAREVVSRTLRRLAARKLVATGRGQITVTNRVELEAVAKG